MIKLGDVPEFGAPAAPPIIAPTGRRRRLHDFPAAAELSAPLLERIDLDAAASAGAGGSGRRRLQSHISGQPPGTTPSAPTWAEGRSVAAAGSLQRHQRLHSRRLQQQQQPAQPQQRPGWPGIWWADAGGVGMAAGPSHVLHAVSSVLAVYTVDSAGAAVATRIVALQDLFAPVGAANCK